MAKLLTPESSFKDVIDLVQGLPTAQQAKAASVVVMLMKRRVELDTSSTPGQPDTESTLRAKDWSITAGLNPSTPDQLRTLEAEAARLLQVKSRDPQARFLLTPYDVVHVDAILKTRTQPTIACSADSKEWWLQVPTKDDKELLKKAKDLTNAIKVRFANQDCFSADTLGHARIYIKSKTPLPPETTEVLSNLAFAYLNTVPICAAGRPTGSQKPLKTEGKPNTPAAEPCPPEDKPSAPLKTPK